MKFGGVLVLVCLTIFANAGRKFCREADQKLEDLANKIEELDCSDLGSTGCEPGPKSCKEIYDKDKPSENKAYMLQMDFGELPVYCNMDGVGLGECGSGGWTLVMKIDGTKRTFHYDSPFWTNKKEYGIPEGETGFDDNESKLPTYWNTPFTKICLIMKIKGRPTTRFLVLNEKARSLYALIADDKYRKTKVGRGAWKKLIGPEASLQLSCYREGFNVAGNNKSFSKARIGYVADQENDCLSCDSRIGFGTGGHQDDSNTCGNEATNFADNGDKHIKAMGYILVQ